jgi:hypothetical protein
LGGPAKLRWYQSRLDSPVYDGCEHTLRQYLCFMLELKVKYGGARSLFDCLLRFNSMGLFMPAGMNNFCPPSWLMLKSLTGVQDYSKYVRHVCVQGCHIFPAEPPRHIRDENDCCPLCGSWRYEYKGNKLLARKVCSSTLLCL